MQAMVLEGTAGKNVIYTLRSPLEKNGIYTGSTILSKDVEAVYKSHRNYQFELSTSLPVFQLFLLVAPYSR